MALDAVRFKSHAAAATVVIVMLAAAAGCWAFFISLRPCRVRLDPGTLISYTLRNETVEIIRDQELAPLITEHEINLICIGADNEVALVSPGTHGKRDEITIMQIAVNGTARRLDRDARAGDEGKALGFFDFNLLPLPPGSEQSWSVPLVYAALPPDKRQVLGKVRRISNSATPEFQLKLPTIAWVNEQNRYLQVRDLTCTYRFHTGKGVVESATIQCLAEVERADGEHRFRVRVDLRLAALNRGKDDTVALRDLAFATAEAQSLPQDERPQRLAPLLRRILASDVQNPRLREIAARLLADSRGAPPPLLQPVQSPAPQPSAPQLQPPSGWAVQVGSAPLNHRSAAERLVTGLVAAGYPANVAVVGNRALVCVGPYPAQDAAVLAELRRRFPKEKPFWVKLGPRS